MELRRGQRSPLTQILQNTNSIFQIELSISGVEVDFSCFGLNTNGKLFSDEYMVFFNQPQTPCDAVLFSTEICSAICSAIFSCDLNKLPEAIEKLSFTAAIDGQETMKQIQLGHLKFLFDGQEVACFNFDSSDFSNEKALMLGDVYRKNGEWRFSAIGQGFNGGLQKLVSYFGGNIESIDEVVATQQKKPVKFEGDIFTHITEQAQQIEIQWNEVFQGILNASQDYEHIDKDNLYALNAKFKTALVRLNSDLESPTLILATTGTTSSGKSTIVNLLCGADLMPRMAQEMSAGVVYINHSVDGKRKLKIHQTEGATWECGEWHDLLDETIQERLTTVMDAFNKLRGINQPATPHIELTYPIACFSDENLLTLNNIPKTTQFKIMDLPGLRNQQDNTNGDDIKNNCRDALCLVAYNMEETDETRRKELVNQVLEQIKQMGGSPARMLFVLNRIDVFRKDPDWERYQSEHIKKTKSEITDILHRELPEHRDVLATLSYSPLSSLPALHAQRIKSNNNKVQAAEELDKHFTSLISQEILDDLPRSTTKWNEREFDRVSKAVWKNSYGSEFFNNLDGHIQAHFSTLVVPTIVQQFEDEVSDVVGQVVRTCYSEMNSSKDDYDKACEKLHNQNVRLRDFLDQAHATLDSAFSSLLDDLKKNPSDDIIFLYLAEDLLKTDIYSNNITEAKLAPLHQWSANLRRAGLSIINDVRTTLESQSLNFSFSPETAQLPVEIQDRLSSACNSYKKAIKDEKKDFYDKQLRDFLDNLDFVVNRVITMKSNVENERIYDTMELLMKHYLNYLQENIETIAPEWNLSISHHVLKELEKPKIKEVNLTGEVTVWKEKCWYTLWLKEHIEKKLPEPKELHKKHDEQINNQIFSLIEPFHEMIRDYLLQVNRKITAEREKILKDFEIKLKQANEKYHDDYNKVLFYWKPLHEQTEKLSFSLNRLVEDGKSA